MVKAQVHYLFASWWIHSIFGNLSKNRLAKLPDVGVYLNFEKAKNSTR